MAPPKVKDTQKIVKNAQRFHNCYLSNSWGTPYSGLYREAALKRGHFHAGNNLYERVRISCISGKMAAKT